MIANLAKTLRRLWTGKPTTALDEARRRVKREREQGREGYLEVTIEAGRETIRPVTFERGEDERRIERRRVEHLRRLERDLGY